MAISENCFRGYILHFKEATMLGMWRYYPFRILFVGVDRASSCPLATTDWYAACDSVLGGCDFGGSDAKLGSEWLLIQMTSKRPT